MRFTNQILLLTLLLGCKARDFDSQLLNQNQARHTLTAEQFVFKVIQQKPQFTSIDQILNRDFLPAEFYGLKNYVLFNQSESPCNNKNGAVSKKFPRTVMFNDDGLILAFTGNPAMKHCYKRLEFIQSHKAQKEYRMGYILEQENGPVRVFFDDLQVKKDCMTGCHGQPPLAIWNIHAAVWPGTIGAHDAKTSLEELREFVIGPRKTGRYQYLEGGYENLEWSSTGLNGGRLLPQKLYKQSELASLSPDLRETLNPLVPNKFAFERLDDILSETKRFDVSVKNAFNSCASCHAKGDTLIPFDDLPALVESLRADSGHLLRDIVRRIRSKDDDVRMPPPPEESLCVDRNLHQLKSLHDSLVTLVPELMVPYRAAQDLCK